jgi:hypothetical protein
MVEPVERAGLKPDEVVAIVAVVASKASAALAMQIHGRVADGAGST